MSNLKFYTITNQDKEMALFVDSIGYHKQDPIHRLHGYPYYTWLQTLEGQGELYFSGQKYTLPPNHGVLLMPNIPHEYKAVSDIWHTSFLTFGGAHAGAILHSFGFASSSAYVWQSEASLDKFVINMIQNLDSITTPVLEGSAMVFQFITLLKKHAAVKNKSSSLSNYYDKIYPVIHWLEQHGHDSSIGLDRMAEQIKVSPQYLNFLFRTLFGMSPYAYLIQFRISKAKQILIEHDLHVTQVAERVGFYDASHFVSTFRKREGMTPDQFRKIYKPRQNG